MTTMTKLPKIELAYEDGPVSLTTDALGALIETINEDIPTSDFDLHLLVCGVNKTYYATIEHPTREEHPDLDPHWLPIIVEQVCFGEVSTGFVVALQVPSLMGLIVPDTKIVVGIGYEATGQTWTCTTINGMALAHPMVAPQMIEDCDAVAKRLWGASWEPTCLHDHDHE